MGARNPFSRKRLYFRSRLIRRIVDWSYRRTYGFTWGDALREKERAQAILAQHEASKHLRELFSDQLDFLDRQLQSVELTSADANEIALRCYELAYRAETRARIPDGRAPCEEEPCLWCRSMRGGCHS